MIISYANEYEKNQNNDEKQIKALKNDPLN